MINVVKCSKIKVKHLHELTETLASLYFSHVTLEVSSESSRTSMCMLLVKLASMNVFYST